MNWLDKIKGYLSLDADREEEQKITDEITSGVHFRGAQLWVLVLAIFIASLGLNVNSTAVIIGAMLISPLMGPIIGMGFAMGVDDLQLLNIAARNLARATVFSVLTATLFFLLSPFGEAQSELLARTSPTLYDVLIAFCGGAAGFIALCTRGKSNVIPGVAIATALMPPLCTAGFGLANGNLRFFLGAFYLYFINSVFICLATYIGVRLMHFRRKDSTSPEKQRRVHHIMLGIVTVTLIPAAFITLHIVNESLMERNVNNFIKNETNLPGTQIISNKMLPSEQVLRLVAVGKEIPSEKIQEMERQLPQYGLTDYRLQVIQGSQSDSLVNQLSQIKERSNDHIQTIHLQQTEIQTLQAQLDYYRRVEVLAPQIVEEASAIYPEVSSLTLSPTLISSDSLTLPVLIAVATTEGRHPLSATTKQQMQSWLKLRTEADSLRLILEHHPSR